MEPIPKSAKTLPGHWLHGFLDLCLLGLLDARRDYGYGLGQRLAAAGFDDVPGGTLYPALLRLERQALVDVTWESSAAGPRRKYYDLTEAGRGALAEQVAAWRRFSQSIDVVAADSAASGGAGLRGAGWGGAGSGGAGSGGAGTGGAGTGGAGIDGAGSGDAVVGSAGTGGFGAGDGSGR